MPYFKSQSKKIYYEKTGHGPTLICISGLGSDHTEWALMRDILAEKNTVITFDHPGIGSSEKIEGTYTTKSLAGCVRDLVSELSLEKVSILGQSMGGAIAQQFALLFPEKLDKLILQATFDSMGVYGQHFVRNILSLLENGVSRAIIAEVLVQVLFGAKFISEEQFTSQLISSITDSLEELDLPNYSNLANACLQHNTRAVLENITSQTLLIAAERDDIATTESIRCMAKRIPNSDMIIIDNCKHGLQYEAPEATSKEILEFLCKGAL